MWCSCGWGSSGSGTECLWKSSRYPEIRKQQILCQPTAVNAMFADIEPIFPPCVYVHVCVFVSVCGQQAVVPMVVCYWLVISVGNRSCYQAWHGDRRGWMMHGTGKLFRHKDNGATHKRQHIHTHAVKMDGYTLAHAPPDSCTHNRPVTQLSANVLAAIDLFSAPWTAL